MALEYTDQEILSMLQTCKDRNGVCTPRLFNETDGTCSASLVMRRFGSWSDAKAKAGIEEDLSHMTGRKQQYTDEDVLEQIRECARRNDGSCTVALMNDEKDLISPSVAVDRFGSWSNAKEKAGLDDGRKNNARPQEFSDEDYYELIRECNEKHGKVTQRLFNDEEDYPSASAVSKRFGSWSKAKEGAGITDTRRSYTDEELLDALRKCEEKHGSVTASRFASDDEFPSPETLQRRFGGWSEAKKKAGVK